MQRFAPFLLDRLFDDAVASPRDPASGLVSLDRLKDTVARDIEALLNTRCTLDQHDMEGYDQASRSVLCFGLEDFSSRSLASVADREFICRAIERAIANHEPRLRQVRVDVDVPAQRGSHLRFTIRALLHLHPLSEPVSFDAVLQAGRRQYQVSTAPLAGSA